MINPQTDPTKSEQIIQQNETVGELDAARGNYKIALLEISEKPNAVALITLDRDGAGWKNEDGESPQSLLLVDIRGVSLSDYGAQKGKNALGMWISGDTQFMLIDPTKYDPTRQASTGFKGVKLGDKLEVGRDDAQLAARFGLGKDVSRKHFGLDYTKDVNGKPALEIHDGDLRQREPKPSTNGTWLTTDYDFLNAAAQQNPYLADIPRKIDAGQ